MATLTCTIQAGNSLSDPLDCSQVATINGFSMPTDWTPAPLSFQFSPDNGVTYFDVFDSDSREIAVDVRLSAFMRLPSGFPVAGKCFLKFRSGRRDFPVVQTAPRSFTVLAS